MSSSSKNSQVIVQQLLKTMGILRNIFKGSDFKKFSKEEGQVAVVSLSLIQLGELVRLILPDLIEAAPSLPWDQLVKLRNDLAHGAMQTNPKLVWTILEDDLPPMHEALKQLQKSFR